MTLTNEQEEKIKAILRSRGAALGYIFGSYARGTAGSLSDLDVSVAFPRDLSIDIQENNVENIRSDLEKIFGHDKVDVVNLQTTKNPLIRYMIAISEGKELYSDDKSLRGDIVYKALRDFEDTKRLRDIQAKALKNLF